MDQATSNNEGRLAVANGEAPTPVEDIFSYGEGMQIDLANQSNAGGWTVLPWP